MKKLCTWSVLRLHGTDCMTDYLNKAVQLYVWLNIAYFILIMNRPQRLQCRMCMREAPAQSNSRKIKYRPQHLFSESAVLFVSFVSVSPVQVFLQLHLPFVVESGVVHRLHLTVHFVLFSDELKVCPSHKCRIHLCSHLNHRITVNNRKQTNYFTRRIYSLLLFCGVS